MESQSVWKGVGGRTRPPLSRDIACDVCVIGAGIAGLTTAYCLAGEGRSVVVLEGKDEIAGGESAYTTAHLSSALDDRFSQLECTRNTETARIAFDSHDAAINWIEATIAAERIGCDFKRVDGFLFPGAEGRHTILAEETAAQRAGAEVTRLDEPLVPAIAPGPWLRFARQGQFHPLKYLVGLAEALERRGGRLYCGTKVEDIEPGGRAAVKEKGGRTANAGHVVIATNTPLLGGVRVNLRLHACTTYAIAMEAPADVMPVGLYWDTDDPYHYMRWQESRRKGPTGVVIVGGEDHKTGQAQNQLERWARLEAWARLHIRGPLRFVSRWSGQVFETLDGLGLIGRDPGRGGNVYIAAGDSGMGMTHGTIAGLLITDLIAGRPNRWEAAYSPSRLPLFSAADLLHESANVAVQYADWLTGGDVANVDAVQPGTGAVIRRRLSKIAVYRDHEGRVHSCSAVCSHMGCIVQWNRGEGTWDCPCHGSRYGVDGKVLHGPAVRDLKKVDEPDMAAHA